MFPIADCSLSLHIGLHSVNLNSKEHRVDTNAVGQNKRRHTTLKRRSTDAKCQPTDLRPSEVKKN